MAAELVSPVQHQAAQVAAEQAEVVMEALVRQVRQIQVAAVAVPLQQMQALAVVLE